MRAPRICREGVLKFHAVFFRDGGWQAEVYQINGGIMQGDEEGGNGRPE